MPPSMSLFGALGRNSVRRAYKTGISIITDDTYIGDVDFLLTYSSSGVRLWKGRSQNCPFSNGVGLNCAAPVESE
jgi:hypothetical protein